LTTQLRGHATSGYAAKLNTLFLQCSKGVISPTKQQLEDELSKGIEEQGKRMKAVLGEQRYEVLRARMMGLIQSAFPNGPPTE
jgi:hypothetical protein